MKVKAAEGLKVPMEGKPMSYINDVEAVEVPDDSAYYARRISDGDLVEVTNTTGTSPIAAVGSGSKQDNKKGNA